MFCDFFPLYAGSSDSRVIVLKQILNEILKLNPPLVINKKFDKDTKNALKQFEIKNFIYKADGKVDSTTWVALARALSALSSDCLRRLVNNNAETAELLGLVPNSAVIKFNDYPSFSIKDLEVVKSGLRLAKKLVGEKGGDKDQVLNKDYKIPSILDLLDGVFVEEVNANTFDGRKSVHFTNSINGKKVLTRTVRQYFVDNRKSVGAIVIFDAGPNGKNVMFLGDYYFNPDRENQDQQRAFMIMHESVHLVANKTDADFGGSKKLSELLVRKIFPVNLGKLGGVA